MAALAVLLAALLPQRKPEQRTSYPALIVSLVGLLRGESVLRRRALTASLSMAAFSAFWTAAALRLAQPPSISTKPESRSLRCLAPAAPL